MEVASPLSFGPSAGTKRSSLACSSLVADDVDERVAKRRRYHGAPDVDSLSEDFSSHSLFFKTRPLGNKSIFSSIGASTSAKIIRSPESGNFDVESDRLVEERKKREDLNRVIDEQASLIESLKAAKSGLEQSLSSLKTDHGRITKENQLLRRAITIQEERRVNADQEIKSVQAEADERVRALNQVILSLRYHLQAQQNVGNDFMHQRPPDVF